jgi:hypothetical protein
LRLPLRQKGKKPLSLSSIIWELPTGDPFYIRAAAATTGYIKIRVYPLKATTQAVAKNVVTVSYLNF